VLAICTDAGGNQKWLKTFGGTYDDRLFSVVETPHHGFTLAGFINSSGAGDYDMT
jgi:hypothetical protein